MPILDERVPAGDPPPMSRPSSSVRVWRAYAALSRDTLAQRCDGPTLIKLRGGHARDYDSEPLWPQPPPRRGRGGAPVSASDSLYTAMVAA
eukprot:gene8860-11352_t